MMGPGITLTNVKPQVPEKKARDGKWIPFQQVDFADKTINQFHIDTRDFHVNRSSVKKELDVFKARNNPERYYHTPQEVLELVHRLYKDSGGMGTWRCLGLVGIYQTAHWELKYIRIVRTDKGFLVCNDKYFFFNKRDLSQPVDQETLHHINR